MSFDTVKTLQASVTKTSSFNSVGVDLGTDFSPESIGRPVKASLVASAVDRAQSNETYSAVLQHSSDNSTWVDCGAAVSFTATGTITLTGFVNRRYVRLAVTLGGTTPSLTYSATVLPLMNSSGVGPDGPSFSFGNTDGTAKTFVSGQSVTLTTTEPLGKIFYTLDGTDPRLFGREYTAALTLTTNVTVKAIVVAGGRISPIVARRYVKQG